MFELFEFFETSASLPAKEVKSPSCLATACDCKLDYTALLDSPGRLGMFLHGRSAMAVSNAENVSMARQRVQMGAHSLHARYYKRLKIKDFPSVPSSGRRIDAGKPHGAIFPATPMSYPVFPVAQLRS